MATSKNALIRYKALDKCFSNSYKRFYINDLISYCSVVLSDHYGKETTVSRRQIFADIDFMKSDAGYEAPITSIKDGRKVFYRYEDSNFSILNRPLTNNEILAIDNTIELISRMRGIPGVEGLQSIETKLINAKGPDDKNPIISFEDNEFLIGIEYLTLLFNFIKNKQVVNIFYRSFKSSETSLYNISPYYLKQYNKRWFLFGWNHDIERIQNLALDRMSGVETGGSTYVTTSLDFEEYFDDIIGVTNFEENSVEKILIDISDNIKPYIQSKPIHGSQKINGNILSIQVKVNYELESLILSYGENMKVIEPKLLEEKILERLDKAISQYSKLKN